RRVVAVALLEAAVGDARHAERGAVVVRRLPRVAHDETHVVDPPDGERVGGAVVRDRADEFVDAQVLRCLGHGGAPLADCPTLPRSMEPGEQIVQLMCGLLCISYRNCVTGRLWCTPCPEP